MFLRKNRKRFDGEIYEYWTLCETVCAARSLRQGVIASLEKFPQKDIAAGWDDLKALLDGRQPSPKQMKFFLRPTERIRAAAGNWPI